MTLSEFKPSAILAPYVAHYRLISTTTGFVNRMLPSTSMAVAVRLRGTLIDHSVTRSILPPAIVSGLQKTARIVEYRPDSCAMIITFTPGGASAFSNHPLNELFRRIVPLDNFFPAPDIAVLKEQLEAASTEQEQVSMTEVFLMKKLIHKRHDPLVRTAVMHIEKNLGNVQISRLCEDLCISRDAFEKRFRKTTGTNPKNFAMIVRMSGITRRMDTPPLLDLAIANGYYDQAHFNKDFRNYTGISPTEFFSSPPICKAASR